MSQLYILFEHASGFAIFRTTEFEEVAVFLPQVKESILNISKFRSNVFFVAFQAFKEQKDALCHMRDTVSGKLSYELQLFLENNVPRSKKSKQPVVLGVEEPDLATAISDKLGNKCISSGLVLEILRGIRFHFYKLVKGFKDENSGTKAQLSLAHIYSRLRLNFDATRQDCMIIESNKLIEKLEKDVNTLGKRIREWYSFHFPELFKIINNDTELYVHCVNIIGDRKNMPEDIEEKLRALLGDSYDVETILSAAHNSMGTDISSIDQKNLKMLCERIISLIDRRKSSIQYLKFKMNHTAPNISSLLGEVVGAKLISRAGGLEKLAKLTSSTIQVLGAEKKFFRTLKVGKEKVPVCGLLSNSAFMGKAGKKKKGRLAKILANKCSLAARVDCFSKTVNKAYGKQLVEEVENSIKYSRKVKLQEDTKMEPSKEKVLAEEKSQYEEAMKKKKRTHTETKDTSDEASEVPVGETKEKKPLKKPKVLKKKKKILVTNTETKYTNDEASEKLIGDSEEMQPLKKRKVLKKKKII